MDLVDTLLELYQIDPGSIPVWRADIDRIDVNSHQSETWWLLAGVAA